jgi:tetratricopeptide (TPR) repeat protein
MKRIALCIAFAIIACMPVWANNNDLLLRQLNLAIENKAHYDAGKLQRIAFYQKQLAITPHLNAQYDICLNLYNEFKAFNYNKAFMYSRKLQQLGQQLKEPSKISYGKIKMGFTMLSSGMFKEAFDALRTVNVQLLPDSVKMEYYLLTARTYYDLADYDKDEYFTANYNQLAGSYIDSASRYCEPNSYSYLYYYGLKYLKAGNFKKAASNLNQLINNHNLSNHELAVTASTLSDVYIQTGKPEQAVGLLIKAAIADIKTSTKETAAMVNLAQLLHKQGEVKKAYFYIKQAMDDATYYGARQRKIQVSAILPVIAGERINTEEEQKQMLFLYAALLTVLAAIIIVFAVIINKQLKKLKVADKIIMEANHELQHTIDQLDVTNHTLKQTISKLDEANHIKEEYIGYYFNIIADYIDKLDKFKRSVENKLLTKKFEDIRTLVNNINLRKEREELFVNFDKAFLKIYPNFVREFNSYFSEENQVKLAHGQLLNTDLRIFALIRLGINDTEKIARILEYSLNTIYNYKARIKGRSTLPNDDFEHAIMAINAM